MLTIAEQRDRPLLVQARLHELEQRPDLHAHAAAAVLDVHAVVPERQLPAAAVVPARIDARAVRLPVQRQPALALPRRLARLVPPDLPAQLAPDRSGPVRLPQRLHADARLVQPAVVPRRQLASQLRRHVVLVRCVHTSCARG